MSGRKLITPPRPREVRTAYHEELGPSERSALMSWAGFTGTFTAVRGITYSIHEGKGPFHDVSVGSAHLHHYMWGIATLAGVGAVAIHGEDHRRRHPVLALTYGAALALIVDEFALLLDLKDVYWAKQGRISVDIGVGLVAVGGTTLAGFPILARLIRDRRRANGGPDQASEHADSTGSADTAKAALASDATPAESGNGASRKGIRAHFQRPARHAAT